MQVLIGSCDGQLLLLLCLQRLRHQHDLLIRLIATATAAAAAGEVVARYLLSVTDRQLCAVERHNRYWLLLL